MSEKKTTMTFRESPINKHRKIRVGWYKDAPKHSAAEQIAGDPQVSRVQKSRLAKSARHREKYRGMTMKYIKQMHRKSCGEFNGKRELTGFTKSLRDFIREDLTVAKPTLPKVEAILVAA